MKNLQKWTLLALFALVAPVTALGAFDDFTDDDEIPLWASPAIYGIRDAGIINGYGDGSFRPDGTINRAEALTILMRMHGITAEDYPGYTDFPDVPEDAWFAPSVELAVEKGWVEGFPDGTFRPGDTLNRAQWAVLLHRAFAFEDMQEEPYEYAGYKDVPSQVWFSEAVNALSAFGLLRQQGEELSPDDGVSRAEAAWQVAGILGETRLMSISLYDIEEIRAQSNRRVAIKPRDFEANKQGYDIRKTEIAIAAAEEETMPTVGPDSGWIQAGTIDITNYYEDRANLSNLSFKLRFERTNVGPNDNFLLRLERDGELQEYAFNSTGTLFVGLDNMDIQPEEVVTYRVAIKADPEKNYFPAAGEADLFVTEASGLALKRSDEPGSASMEISARINLEQTLLAHFTFDPSRD